MKTIEFSTELQSFVENMEFVTISTSLSSFVDECVGHGQREGIYCWSLASLRVIETKHDGIMNQEQVRRKFKAHAKRHQLEISDSVHEFLKEAQQYIEANFDKVNLSQIAEGYVLWFLNQEIGDYKCLQNFDLWYDAGDELGVRFINEFGHNSYYHSFDMFRDDVLSTSLFYEHYFRLSRDVYSEKVFSEAAQRSYASRYTSSCPGEHIGLVRNGLNHGFWRIGKYVKSPYPFSTAKLMYEGEIMKGEEQK